jgi:heme/copper-type cytochrome/quinol oxidase subunit 2
VSAGGDPTTSSSRDAGSRTGLATRAARGGASALLAAAMMVIGSLVLWIGVPAGWLWVGSQIQASSHSVGNAIGIMLVGVVVSVILLAMLLVRLARWHDHLREAAGRPPPQHSLLELVLVVTAGVAVVAFGVWFFIFTGPGPSLSPSN